MTQRFELYLERVDAGANMHRFYALSIEPTLFGEAVLVCRWGRIGTRGRTRLETCASEIEAIKLFAVHLKRRKSRFYTAPRAKAPEGEGRKQFRSR